MAKRTRNPSAEEPDPHRRPAKETYKKWPGWVITVSKLFFICSALFFVICLSRLLCRLFHLCPFSSLAIPPFLVPPLSRLAVRYSAVTQWCCIYAPQPATSAIFMAMGFINFTYSHILAARDKYLYGIRLSDVMQSLFPWHSAAYGLYALWIITGLYCSSMLYPVAAAVCLLGVLCAFFSTGIVAYLFVANYHRKQDMVEYYLCHFKKPSERKSKGKTALSENALDDALADMCAASDYVREYYLATQTVPQAVARHVWTRLWFDLTEAGLPTARPFRPNGGPYWQSPETARNTQLKDVYQTARLISRISAVWRHTLRGLPLDEQATLVSRIFYTVLPDLPDLSDPPDGQGMWFGDESCRAPLSSGQLRFGLPLCGLLAYLKEQAGHTAGKSGDWNGWRQCYDQVYLIICSYPGEKSDGMQTQKYDFIVQLLFLLLEASVTVEACIHTSGRQQKDMEEAWPWLSKLAETLQVSLSWVPRFLPWGQSIFFSSANDWYRSFDGFIEIYSAYQWIWKIFSGFGDTDYRGEAS